MPHYLIIEPPEEPGVVVLDGQVYYVDTGSSESAVSHGHEDLVAQAPPSSELPRGAKQPQRLFRPGKKDAPVRQLLPAEIKRPLAECGQVGLGRELSMSSGTSASAVTAAELYLRTSERLERDAYLSVAALEEFTSLLGSRKTLTTLYHTLAMAKQVHFLRERDVDPLTNRFSGPAAEWTARRAKLEAFVLLNDPYKDFALDPGEINRWLTCQGPVLARVDPRDLIDLNPDRVDLRHNTHHAVVIIGTDEGAQQFTVRTGWRQRPVLKMKYKAPSEAWGLVFSSHQETHGQGSGPA
jgi:hypothetical protein